MGTSVGVILISALVSYLLVLGTGLKGKIGFMLSFVVIATILQVVVGVRKFGRKALGDNIASSLIYVGAALVFLPVFSILYMAIVKGVAGLHPSLFTETMFNASFLDPIDKGGLLHALVGTMYLILIAMVLSVPMGILTALYLTEIRGPGAQFIQFIVQAMSGVPSVVAGLFIFTSVILISPLKTSAATGALALAILMIPTVTRTSQEVLLLVPQDLREAGLALGSTQWKTVANIVVPAARNGLITATILGVARIAGETAPLLFTALSNQFWTSSLSEPMASLPVTIFKFAMSPYENWQKLAWAGVFLITLAVLGLNIVARVLTRQKS
jgi:phosphate transport system permease protein